MDYWNQKNLPQPAVSAYKTANFNMDLNILSSTCCGLKKVFEDNKLMEAEFFLLSRIIYRMKQKFRNSKDFRSLEIVYKCLRMYLNIHLSSHLETFIDLIPSKHKKEMYLPSRYLLDYILIRLQGMSKLLEKLVSDCKETAHLFSDRVKTGQFWKIAIIVYSVVSRVYVLARYTINKICEFYEKLIPFSQKLQTVGKWLYEEYTLPDDLKQWLDVDWLNNGIQLIENLPVVSSITSLYDLVEDSDVEFCDEYILVNENENHKQDNVQDDIQIISVDTEDVGEIVEIDDSIITIQDKLSTKKRLKKKKQIQDKDVIEVVDNSLVTNHNFIPKTNKKRKKGQKDVILDITEREFIPLKKSKKNSNKLEKRKKNRTKNVRAVRSKLAE